MGWQGIDISGGAMGARAVNAPDFSGVINSTPVNTDVVTLTPNSICANIEDPLGEPCSTELNGLQKFLLPFLAQGITGHKPGTDEHAQVLADLRCEDISAQTVPPDFRNRKIHRCWRIGKP